MKRYSNFSRQAELKNFTNLLFVYRRLRYIPSIIIMNTIFENKFCKLVFKGTLIVLISKGNKYNDMYFNSRSEANNYMLNLGIKI